MVCLWISKNGCYESPYIVTGDKARAKHRLRGRTETHSMIGLLERGKPRTWRQTNANEVLNGKMIRKKII